MDRPRARRLVRRAALVSALTLAVGVSFGPLGADAQPGSGTDATLSAAARADRAGPGLRSADPGVMANLWEWNWNSVARECTDVLGPAGYGGVQVAPPQDSLKRTALGNGSDTVLHPWWEVYQPVRYALTSRMGDEAEFQAMVRTCRRAGVKVYVDAVINHMTGQGNRSYGGVSYSRYNYPGLYDAANFNSYPEDCPIAPVPPVPPGEQQSQNGIIADFNNQRQVFNCDLVNLTDLDTSQREVRRKEAAYLNKLLRYGVSGFRIDAAKHVGQQDLNALYRRLNDTVDGTRPAWVLEVFGGGPGILSPEAFTSSGQVLGLDAAVQLKSAFKSYTAERVGSISTLKVFGPGSGLPDSEDTWTFAQNHDTERGSDTLSYKDGDTNVLATQFLLAYGYGTPQVYAAFEFGSDTAQSPPSDAEGFITDTDCDDGWACTNRDRRITAMVGWHNFVGQARLRHWWDDGENVVAFSRGNRGWIALNNGTQAKQINVQTGLPAGTYCDITRGGLTAQRCSGPTVRVRAGGKARVTVPAKSAVAFTRSDRVR